MPPTRPPTPTSEAESRPPFRRTLLLFVIVVALAVPLAVILLTGLADRSSVTLGPFLARPIPIEATPTPMPEPDPITRHDPEAELPVGASEELAGLVAAARQAGDTEPAAVLVDDQVVFYGSVPTDALASSIIDEARAILGNERVVDLLLVSPDAVAPTSMTISAASSDLLGDPDGADDTGLADDTDLADDAVAAAEARLGELASALATSLAERPALSIAVVATAEEGREPGPGAFLAGSRVRDALVEAGIDPERIRVVARAATVPTGVGAPRIDLVVAAN